MGSNILENICKTVAIRYRFIEVVGENGEPEIRFIPHEVQKCEISTNSSDEEEEIATEVDVNYLRSLDPKEWKKQDHYRVLGLQKLRHKATDENIKAAYRKIVLKHHPDKRKALGEEIRPDDDYYTCITMAYETLGNPIKRRAYDSVDPEFDNSIPTVNELKTDFYKVAKYYFDLNSRWSENPKVPLFGDENSSRINVDNFYTFWYSFKSWREYSYEDEEDKEKCQDRDERRMCEKINKAERQRKKKEEMSRIRNLVDIVYNSDPRIFKFKQEDKERKLAAKRAKQTAAQAKKEEEERVLKEAQKAKEKADAEEKARTEAKRQEREAQKKALKKERKMLRDTCKNNNHFSANDQENLIHMQGVDKICETFTLAELEHLNQTLQVNGKESFIAALQICEKRIEEEREKVLQAAYQKGTEESKALQNGLNLKAEWTQDHIQLLIKAVNLFPAGTNQRWEVVANFINQHGTIPDGHLKFNAKDVLAKAKDLQNTDFSKSDLKEAANRRAFDNFEKEKKSQKIVENSDITKKVETHIPKSKGVKTKLENNSNMASKSETKSEIPWTAAEQQLLEQALKTYPASTPDRWDRVAECVSNRTKKECMKRFKELVEIVKAKKAAQAATNSK
ncbi:dnaJ homolog subfamily C member 2 [Agrilus planipennis]|uniref:DnaJ homolog subfamily C member 2 n=1 Tax=Agrilus planipennis TaxID=224129 RepID=A0A1W4WMD6_AGRPL|nr:dnaJ homolog subfamily C member 2 [Agrilus planipennis]